MDAQERGDFSEIPILDVSPLYGDDEGAIRETAATLRRYLETIGFLYVTGHPIPRTDVEAVREASKRFFALPEEEKAKLKIFPRLLALCRLDHRDLVRGGRQQAEPERIDLLHARGRRRRPPGLGRQAAARPQPVA
ncbi:MULTISPECIES: 2-oxoglutarate and iron-dependent oxygenase domain-containing protein [unclassified Mesorhizobium]|uniref:2-oxoglutarate and iron-dependent oxygenase domain-containing protein n=1 Tax=unclassified Mesorhizobium TaxID=325217 RepID=UPI001FED2D37|nr:MULTISPECIES: 2-oxoglutarate and iron-dependent oxygenase domain-containing protein [unclassified Mesorhizobium]